jgi:photosystem II stability/assembly factor-like uncharacterized protein
MVKLMKKFILLFSLVALAFSCSLSFPQWKQSLSPVVGSVYSLAANNSFVIAGADSGIYITSDNGVNWTQPVTPPAKSAFPLSLAISGSNFFAGTYLGGVWRSTNNGSVWTKMNNGLPSSFSVFALAVNASYIFAGSDGGGLFRSTNNGSSWTQVNNGLSNLSVRSLSLLGSSVLAGTSGGGIYLSTNNGANWSIASMNSNGYIYSLLSVGSNFFAGTNLGLFLFSYNGSIWTSDKKDLNPIVLSLSLSGSEIFAGTDSSGVFRSHDNGSTWLDANDGLSNLHVHSIAVGATTIYAATIGAGVWNRPLAEVTSISKKSSPLPKDFSLSQNYPNPFNPSTIISYSLPSASNVKLIIYNALGQSISLLENSFKQPGTYSVSFNASALPSGVYFYKLEAGPFSQLKKMILLK